MKVNLRTCIQCMSHHNFSRQESHVHGTVIKCKYGISVLALLTYCWMVWIMVDIFVSYLNFFLFLKVKAPKRQYILDSRAVVVAEKNWGSLRIKLFNTAVTNIQHCKNHKYCRFTRITFQSKLPVNIAKVLRPTNIT